MVTPSEHANCKGAHKSDISVSNLIFGTSEDAMENFYSDIFCLKLRNITGVQ